MIRKIHRALRAGGVKSLFDMGFQRIFPRRLASYQAHLAFFQEKVGLEVGGPSGTFKRTGLLPVYPIAERIDNCNFGGNTTWEGAIEEGSTFYYDKQHAPGTQYISEATSLARIRADSYDFVLSSHTLEHVANPLAAIAEWTRVLKDDGILVLIVPHRDGTFDHRRPITSLSHLIQDFEQNVTEADLTHLDEILELHDMAMDPGAGDAESFRRRSEDNIENRCLHHHVFNTHLAVELINHVGLQIIDVEALKPHDICVIARKAAPGRRVQNEPFRGSAPVWRSAFPSDRTRELP